MELTPNRLPAAYEKNRIRHASRLAQAQAVAARALAESIPDLRALQRACQEKGDWKGAQVLSAELREIVSMNPGAVKEINLHVHQQGSGGGIHADEPVPITEDWYANVVKDVEAQMDAQGSNGNGSE